MNNFNTLSKIYYYCYDTNIPSGGVKVLYQHVDILIKYGFSAYILHEKSGFRCTWFENSTPVVSINESRIQPTDYLVVPEECFTEFAKTMKSFKTVVLNQNCYYTFSNGYSFNKNELTTPYLDKNLIAALVVSEDNKQYLSYAFPELKVVRIHNAIDPKIFSYQEHKKPIISFMIRKNAADCLQVINILKFRNALVDFEIAPIHNKTEKEVAQILRESLIFLSFGYPEGCPLPPAEAMACGCIVVGYHGMGGREYFKSEFAYPVAHGDIISFVQTVEKVIEMYEHDKNNLKEKGRLASQYVYNNYSVEQQEKDVVQFWDNIIRNVGFLKA
jgi:dimeric dUTPase (all-alpha-NTP-PPase superfamily)